jgi:hypothetical protein
MAFEQYTKCIEPSGYVDVEHHLVALVQSLLVTATGTAAALVAGRPDCWLILAELLAVTWVLAYCRLFLYGRLICLGPDQDAIGAVVRVDRSGVLDLPDSDFNVNLLLEPNEFGAKRPQVVTSTPYGFLVADQPKITARGLATAGHTSTDNATQTVSETLHCEFEGAGAYVLLVAAEAAFAATVAALLLCIYLPPIPGLSTIITVLALLALALLLLGGLIGIGSGASPSDTTPGIGEIHTNDDANNGFGSGADILYIRGAWVFDPWHEGWNEIHPVKVCTKIGKWEGGWDLPGDVILRVRSQFDLAAAPDTKAAQARPEHQWTVHPALDACSSVIIT